MQKKILSTKNKNKKTETVNPKVLKTKSGKTMLLSKCAVCISKEPRFIKEHEAKGLLSSLGINPPLNKIALLGKIFF